MPRRRALRLRDVQSRGAGDAELPHVALAATTHAAVARVAVDAAAVAADATTHAVAADAAAAVAALSADTCAVRAQMNKP